MRHVTAASVTVLLLATAIAVAPAEAAPPGDLSFEMIASVDRPTAIKDSNDGTNRLFINEKAGRIFIFDTDTDTLLPTPFLNITTLVDDGGNEQGLLGLVFDPDYANNGYFYVNYTRDPGPGLDRTRIARYQVSAGDPNVADANSGVVVLEIEQDFSNHNGGDLHFGPDGYLYIGMGDGGSGGDPNERAQDPDQLLGKMLRIDVSTTSRSAQGSTDLGGSADTEFFGAVDNCGLNPNYSVPADNPFINADDTCDEIWALGVRNPYRFSFDQETGDLWIGDVGQNAREEIDFQDASSTGGENYGWDCREGTIFHETCMNPPTFVDPVLDYTHGGGRCSITGGFVYRGSAASMRGDYIYADYCSGDIWYTNEAGGFTQNDLGFDFSFITTFGQDRFGEMYFGADNGNIYRFTSSEIVPGGVFADGFETNDTSEWDATVN